MSFWDNYKDVGGNFIKAEEKQVLIDNGIPLTVTSIVEDENEKFGQPRFVAKVEVPDPSTGEAEERSLSFPRGSGADSRDRMLGQMMAYLDDGGEPVEIKLVKVGRAILVEKA